MIGLNDFKKNWTCHKSHTPTPERANIAVFIELHFNEISTVYILMKGSSHVKCISHLFLRNAGFIVKKDCSRSRLNIKIQDGRIFSKLAIKQKMWKFLWQVKSICTSPGFGGGEQYFFIHFAASDFPQNHGVAWF